MQAFVLRKTRNKILAAFLSSKLRGVKLITYRGLELAKSICAPNLEAIGSNAKFCEFISFYKITEIVRALWLAERRVCMRVCKHGCDANLFGFPRANHASTNLKKVLSWKTRQVYFIYPFPRRLKLEKSLETCWVHLCLLELTRILENVFYCLIRSWRSYIHNIQDPETIYKSRFLRKRD